MNEIELFLINKKASPMTNYIPFILFPLNAYEVSFQVRTSETIAPSLRIHL